MVPLLLLATFLALTCASPFAAEAHAETLNSVKLTTGTGSDAKTIDVTQEVATLAKDDKLSVKLAFDDTCQSAKRAIFAVDAAGKETEVASTTDKELIVVASKFGGAAKVVAKATSTSAVNQEPYYTKELNIRIADSTKIKEKVSLDLANGLNITLPDSKLGKFFKNQVISLNALNLPLTYKHNPDGTTIVGICADANNVALYKAIKNGNVWQKYSDKALGDMAEALYKGFNGKGIGTWGKKGLDWSIFGYGEFNTNDPLAPWTINLAGTIGIQVEGHAQYLIFTGSLTGNASGKASVSMRYQPKDSNLSGSFDVGVRGSLEVFGGLGLSSLAAVGAYGKGTLDIDAGVLPKSNFGLKAISASGEAGLKAKLFGFNIATWKILNGGPWYIYQRDKKAPSQLQAGRLQFDEPSNSLMVVSSDVEYPQMSRDYLNAASSWNGDAQLATQAEGSSGEAVPLVKNIYGASDLESAQTKSGPVIVYIADANQVDTATNRDVNANRTVLVYTRYKNGTWTPPVAIDAVGDGYAASADYLPSIWATPDSDDFHVAWLDAKEPIATSNDAKVTLGDVARKLDVRYAKVPANGTPSIETVASTSSDTATLPASPRVVVGSDGKPQVSWITNMIAGNDGQLLGMSGEHTVVIAKRDGAESWAQSSLKTENGAVTSFEAGIQGSEPTVAWSIDSGYAGRAKSGSAWEASQLATPVSLDEKAAVYKAMFGMSAQAKVDSEAANPQFASVNGTPALTYAKRVGTESDGFSISILNDNAGHDTVLDGTAVDLPTAHYTLSGDLAKSDSQGMVVFTKVDGGADVAALVSEGAGAADWSPIVEATDTDDTRSVTDFDAVYHNGEPLFVYTTESVQSLKEDGQDDVLFTQAEAAEKDSADLYAATGRALQRITIDNVDYDGVEAVSDSLMPVEVDFTNNGLTAVDGVDVYVYDSTMSNGPQKVATTSESLYPGAFGETKFSLAIPPRSQFDKQLHYYFLAVPKGSAAPTSERMTAESNATFDFEVGKPHLSVSTDHRLVDGQESVVATVKNEGMLTSQPGKVVFEEAGSGLDLHTVDVPALGENAEFMCEYKAKKGMFRSTGVENLRVMLTGPDSDAEAGSLHNTDLVSTWEAQAGSQQQSSEAKTASRNEAIPVNAGFPSSTNSGEDLSSAFYYSDSLFAEASSAYSDDLAAASVNLAAAAQNSNRGDYASKSSNVSRLLTDIGCSDVQVNEGYAAKPGEKSNIGVAIGTKSIRVNGKNYRLFAIGVRGGGYEGEWASNLKVGTGEETGGDHEGFQEARDAALAFVMPYIQAHVQAGEQVKVWTAGYGRGGAVANMMSAWLDKWVYERNNAKSLQSHNGSFREDHSVLGAGSFDTSALRFTERVSYSPGYIDASVGFSEGDVYCYTVNAPQGASKSDVDAHASVTGGIHNLVNPDDWMAQTALGWDKWSFARYGVDHDITGTYADAASLAGRAKSILDANGASAGEMLARLAKINPDAALESLTFRQYGFEKSSFTMQLDEAGAGNTIISQNKELKRNQGKYFEEFVKFALQATGCDARTAYASKLQEGASYLMGLLRGVPADVQGKMDGAIKKHLLAEIARVGGVDLTTASGKTVFLGKLDGWMAASSSVPADVIEGAFSKALQELGVTFDASKLKHTSQTFAQVLKDFYAQEQAIAASSFYHFSTAYKGAAGVSQTHYPEVALAWLPVAQKKNVVIVDSATAGAGMVSGEGVYAQGATVELTAKAASGYAFAGWYENGKRLSGEATYPMTVEGNRHIEARWTAADASERTLIFNANGGMFANGGTGGNNGVATVKAKAGQNVQAPEAPTYAGRVFEGWTEKRDDSSTLVDAGALVMPDQDAELFALWREQGAAPTTCTVSFDANGGAGEMSAQNATRGSSLPVPACTFTRAGYDFASWNTAADGSGRSYASGEELYVSGAITLYAQWKESLHEISFRVDGGNLGETITRRTGETFGALPNPKEILEEGVRVASWNAYNGAGELIWTDVQADDIVSAAFPSAPEPIVLVAETEQLPSRVVKFYSNLDGKQQVGGEPLFEVTVYEGASKRFTDDAEDSGAPDAGQIVRYTTPIRTGYSFIGWETKADDEFGPRQPTYYATDSKIGYDDIPEAGLDLFAEWARGEIYEIDYHANGGAGAAGAGAGAGATSVAGGSDVVVRFSSGEGDKIAIEPSPFTRSGFAFTGWNTDAAGGGIAVPAASQASLGALGLPSYDELGKLIEQAQTDEEFEAALQKGTLHLYAQWKPVVGTAAPKLAISVNAAKKRATLTWGAVENATKYTVSWRIRGGKWQTATATKSSHVVTGLKANKAYEFRVRGANDVSMGAWSKVGYGFMKTTVKVKVTTGVKKAAVTWKRTKGATGYLVTFGVGKKMKAAKTVKVKKGAVTKRVIKKLKPGKRYYAQVTPLKKVSGVVYVGSPSAKASAVVKRR